MDFDRIIGFLEKGDIGLTLSVEDVDVLEVKVKDKNVDLNILDMDRFGKLKEEFEEWKA